MALQFFPVFKSAAEVGYDDGAADKGGDAHGFVHFGSGETYLFAFAEVIFYTVVAAEHEGAGEADKLLGFYIQGAFGVGVGIEVEDAFDDQAVGVHDLFVHLRSVFVEVVY
jgi:hypothetical protein